MSTMLFLCTANILRSPSAELLARARGAEDRGWQLTSAGMRALPGHPIDADAGAALRELGIASGDHRAGQATPRLLRSAGLVLTFENRHRSWVLEQEPSLVGRVLTIVRAADLLAAKPRRAEPLDHLRWDSRPYGSADEFGDPVGTGAVAVAAAVREIDRLLGVILPALGTAPPVAP